MQQFKRYFTLFLLLVSSVLLAQNREKQIRKTFPLSSDGQVKIENKFGSVEFNTWEKNEVNIVVEMTVKNGSDERAAAFLNDIEIVFEHNPESVSAITKLPSGSKQWFRNIFSFGKKNLNYAINYTIQFPKTAGVNVSNEFGDILIDTLQGQATIDCEFGNLEAEALLHKNNVVELEFSSKSFINQWNGGKIKAAFSDLVVEKAQAIELTAEHTKTTLGQINSLIMDLEYGNLAVEQAVDSLQGKAEFLNARIEKVTHHSNLRTEFGKLRINEIGPITKEFILRTEFTGVRLGLHPAWAFVYDFTSSFTTINSDIELNHSKTIIDNNLHHHEGIQKTAENVFTINAEFGNVKLFNSTKQ